MGRSCLNETMRRWIGFVALCAVGGLIWWWSTRAPDSARNADLRLVGESHDAAEARISLRALNRGGDIVTVVSEIRYDAQVLRLKSCGSDGARAGKQLHFRETEPGRVRAVLAGSLDPMPADSEVIACTFSIARKDVGRTLIQASGEVADLQFVDRPFQLSREISLGS